MASTSQTIRESHRRSPSGLAMTLTWISATSALLLARLFCLLCHVLLPSLYHFRLSRWSHWSRQLHKAPYLLRNSVIIWHRLRHWLRIDKGLVHLWHLHLGHL